MSTESTPLNTVYICPLCNSPLTHQATNNSYTCFNRHSFDCAKEGYINLLPVHHKHSKEPGDNKAMLTARRLFLEAGYYEPLARAITLMIDTVQPLTHKAHILDLGCGEGYYARKIIELCKRPEHIQLYGNDISKFAMTAAAKKQKTAQFIVASSNKLPYATDTFDIVYRVFAPSDATELYRLIKPAGYLLTVTPGPRHLWQLKEHIYTEVTEHTEDAEIPMGFTPITSQRVSYKISPDAAHRKALLEMTPFAWSASEVIKDTLKNLSELEIEADFIMTLSVKSGL